MSNIGKPGHSGQDRDEERLRALLHDAVSDVDPSDGLAEVRRRTRARRTSTSRRWAPVLVGAGAVAATVVVATVVVNAVNDDRAPNDPPVASSGTSADSEDQITAAAGLYFVGKSPTGPRLYREFQAVTPTEDPEQKVLLALQRLTFGPRDPDYDTLWPADSFAAVRVEDDRVVVELGTDAALEPSGAAALLGVQQAVYTAEAALGETLPLAFERDGQPAGSVLGLPVAALVERLRSTDLTAPVNISDPSEQLTIEEDSFVANGTMSANVQSGVTWALLRAGEVVREGEAVPLDITGPDARATLHAPGWATDPIDLGGLAPGDYTFEVNVLDAGQTSDRPTEFSDTRTITVR